jgi:hypothetical protein
LPDEDVYRCPANEKPSYRYTNIESGQTLRRYWTNRCGSCALKELCMTGKERRITRHEDEHVLEAVQRRLDAASGPTVTAPGVALGRSRKRSRKKWPRSAALRYCGAIPARRTPPRRVITQPRNRVPVQIRKRFTRGIGVRR